MILYALYVDAIFFPCHPYIWSTTVLHDSPLSNIVHKLSIYANSMATTCTVQYIHIRQDYTGFSYFRY